MHGRNDMNQNLNMVKYEQNLLKVEPKACQNDDQQQDTHQASEWKCTTSAWSMQEAIKPTLDRVMTC